MELSTCAASRKWANAVGHDRFVGSDNDVKTHDQSPRFGELRQFGEEP
ncbi:MAG: hypothetical protein H0X39_09350 [Actinobacteria bacterium]|nr:hypothetical protein [Actinomycetota bacterium]